MFLLFKRYSTTMYASMMTIVIVRTLTSTALPFVVLNTANQNICSDCNRLGT